MDKTLLYFAYGSNLHPERLGARIPSSRFLSVAPLSGYQLRFHKRGEDLSAKCNAVYTGNKSDLILGAVFEMNASEKLILDEIEGEGYVVNTLEIEADGRLQQAFMYVAETHFIDDSLDPFEWYKDFVHLGAQYHQFPEPYLKAINAVKAVVDQNEERHIANDLVLARMRSGV